LAQRKVNVWWRWWWSGLGFFDFHGRRRGFYGNVRGLALFAPCFVPCKSPLFALFICEGWSASVAFWFRCADRRGRSRNGSQKRHKAKAFLGLSPR
jgi:hypothetical protein